MSSSSSKKRRMSMKTTPIGSVIGLGSNDSTPVTPGLGASGLSRESRESLTSNEILPDPFSSPVIDGPGLQQHHSITNKNSSKPSWEEPRSLTEDHKRLLYLISRYSRLAHTSEEKERWIRHLPLMVLIHEGIVTQLFEDYDYGPAMETFGRRHVWINVSQEGRDDIDDLREMGLINSLKLSSSHYQPVTAYQLSKHGETALSTQVTPEIREAVDDMIQVPGAPEDVLLDVKWNEDDDVFYLTSQKPKVWPYARPSSITDIEDVSYVSSPYLPSSLLTRYRGELTCNASRAAESAAGSSNVQDVLDEKIFLSDVSLLIAEYIPCGSNQIVALNDRLGASERVQGGLFTAVVDRNPDGTNIEVSPGLTQVVILDHDQSRYLNFEAEVHYPEAEGIVQVETFGVHTRNDGSVYYGLKVEAIDDSVRNHLSVDKLSRVCCDVQQDSSRIMDSLISSYQRTLLDIVYHGDSSNRQKYCAFIASAIEPKLSPEEFMDKEENENELRQILGDLYGAYDLEDDLVLISGRYGLVLAGPTASQYEELLLDALAVTSREVFINELFHRTFAVGETLQEIRRTMDTYESNPNSIPLIRQLLSNTFKDTIHLQELLAYLEESAEVLMDRASADRSGSAYEELSRLLGLANRRSVLRNRIADLKKNCLGTASELEGLRSMTDVISEALMFRLQEAMQANTKNLEDVFRSNERASSSLEVMQVILSGTLAFELLDRLTGEWSVTDQTWAQEYIVKPLMHKPGVWFMINLGMWAAIALMLMFLMKHLTDRAVGVLSLRIRINRRIDVRALYAWLASKDVGQEDVEREGQMNRSKVEWMEQPDEAKWLASPPKIQIVFDAVHEYLLNAFIQVSKSTKHLTVEQLREEFDAELERAGVYVEDREDDVHPPFLNGRISSSRSGTPRRWSSRSPSGGSLGRSSDGGGRSVSLGEAVSRYQADASRGSLRRRRR